MQQIIDIEKYDQYQKVLVREIIEQVRFKLAKSGVSGDALHDMTLEIAFSVTSILDDQALIEHNGVRARPYLAFIGEEGETIHCGENAYMHEFVSDEIKKAFIG